MKKVLFLNHTGSILGSETILLQILNFCAKEKDLQLHVIYLKTSHKEFENAIKKLGIIYYKAVYYKMIDCSFFRTIIKLCLSIIAFVEIVSYVKKNKIDIIYSNTIINIFGIMVAKLTNRKHIWHFHEEPYEGYPWIHPIFLGLYRYLLKYSKNTIVCISQKQKGVWEKVFNIQLLKSVVVYNPLKHIEKKIVNICGFDVSFGYLGGFIQERKNVLTLLKCFCRLSQDSPMCKMRLIMKGQGPLEKQMKEFIEINNLSEKVILQSYSSELSSFFSSINVFVLPAYFESWGLVAIEAMSLGKYTIITKNTPISELIPEKYYTYIDPYDEDSLYNAMKKALTAPAIPQSQTDQLNEIMRKNNENFYQNIRNIVFNL